MCPGGAATSARSARARSSRWAPFNLYIRTHKSGRKNDDFLTGRGSALDVVFRGFGQQVRCYTLFRDVLHSVPGKMPVFEGVGDAEIGSGKSQCAVGRGRGFD